MRKVLLINNGYPSKAQPNYVTYIKSIEMCLNDAGFHVDLLVLDSNFNSSSGKYLQFFRYYLKAIFFRYYRNYEYVYINNYPYSFLPLIPNFRKMRGVIVHWHGDDIFPGSFFSKFLNWVSYKFLRNDVIHMAPSHYFAGQVAKRLGIDEASVIVSPSGGVDTDRFVKKDSCGLKEGIIRIGFASGLLRSKGIELVIKLLGEAEHIEAKVHRKIEFHYIDYGKERQLFGRHLENMKGTVKHQPYPIEEMVNFYNQIDILLFPSLRKAESLGLVAIEAMACNVPVIATDNFAFIETVIEGISGERFEMNDFDSFKKALIKCITNFEDYSPREYVIKNYGKKSVSEEYSTRL